MDLHRGDPLQGEVLLRNGGMMKKTKKPKPEYLLQLDGAVYFVEKLPGKRAKKTELDGESVLRIIEKTIAEYANKELQKAAIDQAWWEWGVAARKRLGKIEFDLTEPDEFSSPPR